MQRHQLTQLPDHELIRDLGRLVATDRQSTADLLAHLAEVDARKLYAPAGYDSMYAWCVGRLGFSEDMACKRIEAARTARRFPAIFPAVADGRLHLSAVLVLAPHLSEDNAAELLAAAANQTRAGIVQWLATRFPRPDVATRLVPLTTPVIGGAAAAMASDPSAPGRINFAPPAQVASTAAPEMAPAHATPPERGKLTPLSPGRFALQVTLPGAAVEELRYAQALLGHAVAPGDVAQVLERALAALVDKLERQRFARCARERAPRRGRDDARRIPARVRREVWVRNGGKCTLVSADGHACAATARLQFDHVLPVARGGRASAENLRLRCRTHNQLAAEQCYGAGFMQGKRSAAASARSAGRHTGPTPMPTPVVVQLDPDDDMIRALRNLGVRREAMLRAVEAAAQLGPAPLEQRLRAVLRTLMPASARRDTAAVGWT